MNIRRNLRRRDYPDPGKNGLKPAAQMVPCRTLTKKHGRCRKSIGPDYLFQRIHETAQRRGRFPPGIGQQARGALALEGRDDLLLDSRVQHPHSQPPVGIEQRLDQAAARAV